MGVHVHDPFQDEHIERWGAERMRRHLRDVHEMGQLPMAWDIGRLHQAHLDAHQAVKRAASPEPEAEDPQVCGAFYGLGGGLAGQCARPVNHPPISVDGIGHNQQPIPIQTTACGVVSDDYPTELICEYPAGHGPVHPNDDPDEEPMDHGAPSKGGWFNIFTTAEEAPMAQTTPHEHTAAEHRGGPELAQHLGKIHGYHSSNDLEDFGVTHRRLHAEQRTTLREQDPEWDARQQESVRQDEDRRVTVDRIICTLAGLDFDSDWAADSGIGPNARGAVRKVYVEQAEKLLTWLERGGAMALPGYASIGTDLEREQALV